MKQSKRKYRKHPRVKTSDAVKLVKRWLLGESTYAVASGDYRLAAMVQAWGARGVRPEILAAAKMELGGNYFRNV